MHHYIVVIMNQHFSCMVKTFSAVKNAQLFMQTLLFWRVFIKNKSVSTHLMFILIKLQFYINILLNVSIFLRQTKLFK